MANKIRIHFTKDEIKDVIDKTKSMGAAAAMLQIDKRTFKRIALEYGLYEASPEKVNVKFNLQDILNGEYPQYPTSKLSKRLVREGLKEYKCEGCGISEWKGLDISLELDHINGNSSDHSLSNLRLLCPNCHSQTPTYRSKKLKLKLKH